MKDLILFLLVTHGLVIISEKNLIFEKVSKWSMKRNIKIVFEAMDCLFCRSHHFAVVVTLMSSPYFGLNWEMIVWPLCFASFETIVRK